MFDELHVLPIDPDNQKKVGHDYETAGFTGPDRGECIVVGTNFTGPDKSFTTMMENNDFDLQQTC